MEAGPGNEGHAFPEGAYELTPLDADPEARTWMLQNWVRERAADPELLAQIASETARIPLGTWLGVARALFSFDNRARLEEMAVPTLVLWPTQDEFFPDSPYQEELRRSLERAVASCRSSYFAFKQYGIRPLPPSGMAEDDLGHNFHWGAPEEVARDLAAFLRESGEPTRDLTFLDPASGLRTSAGEAVLMESRARSCSR